MSDLTPYFAGILECLGRPLAKAHAKKGGEIGINGQQYEGGQFLPGSKDTDKGVHKKAKPTKGTGKQEVAPYQWEEPPAPGAHSLWRSLGVGQWTALDRSTGQVILNPVLNWDYMAHQHGTTPEELKAEYQARADSYNGGERWTWPIDLNRDVPVVHPPSMGGNEAGKEKARAWGMANLKGSYENESTGWDVDVAGRGIKEGLAHLDWDTPAALQTMAAIPELIRVAVPVQTEPNKSPKHQPDIRRVHTLIAPILVGGEVRRARITIRETNMGEKYYGHRLERLDIETSGALPEGLTPKERWAVSQHPDTFKLGQLLQGFKPHQGPKP